MQETQVWSLGGEDPLEGRAWQPAPVFLPGKPHGQRILAGYSSWGHKEWDTTEQLTLPLAFPCVFTFMISLSKGICLPLKKIEPSTRFSCSSSQAKLSY